jgi:eukaryotic-like serine/threonine-protein kinase
MTRQVDAPPNVVDARNTVHRLGRCLGTGGQGAVYSVDEGKLAVKLLRLATATNREYLRVQLARVRRLPLEDVPIARPLEMLQPPHVGYVMERLHDMVPLRSIMRPPKGTRHLMDWYVETGGLRRRLRVLARSGDALAHLHDRGLVFGDPSPANLFVSSDSAECEARLIDADNIHSDNGPGPEAIFTLPYGAPELVLGKAGNTTLSDAHAFATLVFETLACVHPLVGDMVVDGDPELEQAAVEGRLPWIDDPNDEANRSSQGIDRRIVLSPFLTRLAQRAFGAGLRDPRKRPGIGEWVDALDAAADFTLRCPECKSTYYARGTQCPFCDSAIPEFIVGFVRRFDPGAGSIVALQNLPVLAMAHGETLPITRRLTAGARGKFATRREFDLRLVRSGRRTFVEIVDHGEGEIFVTTPDGGSVRGPIPVEPGYILHLGAQDTPHRVVEFKMVGRNRQ